MDTVQALRARAQQAGNLQDSSQQKVVVQEKIIVIEPAQPQVVYVPYYSPVLHGRMSKKQRAALIAELDALAPQAPGILLATRRCCGCGTSGSGCDQQ
jgi:hypothetical protein